MDKISLTYRLNEAGISQYIFAIFGSSNGLPKRALDLIIQRLKKYDEKITLDVGKESISRGNEKRMNFPRNFNLERKVEGEDIHLWNLKRLRDLTTEIETAVKDSIIPYSLESRSVQIS